MSRVVAALSASLLVACGTPSEAPEPTPEPTPAPYVEPAPPDCGAPVVPGSVEGLTRWPYLGDVTRTSVRMAFGGGDSAQTATVRFGPSASMDSSLTPSRSVIPGSGSDIALFETRIEGLQPGTEYCYAVDIDGTTVASGLTFRTAPDHPDAPVRFLAIGDFGGGTPEQLALAGRMAGRLDRTDLFLTTGDNAYGDGDWDEIHDFVFAPYQDILTRLPFYPTHGNHDYKTDRAAPSLANYLLPENALKEEQHERFWSFDYGPVHFVGLDCVEGILDITDTSMIEWLVQDLRSHDRPWTVALWHYPILTGHPERDGDGLMISRVLPILQDRVDLVLVGHDHFYERFQRLRFDGNTAVADPEDGFHYVITGAGGKSLYDVEPHPLDVTRVQQHHFTWVEVDSCRLHLEAEDLDGNEIDDFVIDKCAEGAARSGEGR